MKFADYKNRGLARRRAQIGKGQQKPKPNSPNANGEQATTRAMFAHHPTLWVVHVSRRALRAVSLRWDDSRRGPRWRGFRCDAHALNPAQTQWPFVTPLGGDDASTRRRGRLWVWLDDDLVCSASVATAAHLSWRDRRFQQAAEIGLLFPTLGEDVWCDDDGHGQVHALAAAVRTHWLDVAQSLGCQLAVLAPMSARRGHWMGMRPNWALAPWQCWVRDWVLDWAWAVASRCVISRAMQRLMVWSAATGALLGVLGLHGLQAWAQMREREQQTDRHIAELQARLQAHQRAQDEQQAQRDTQAERMRHLQTHANSAAGSLQWMRVLSQAQGVWLQSLSVQPHASVLQWRLQGEALAPEHAQALQQALREWPGWHAPPSLQDGQWRHGQNGRLSVWLFEIQAEVPAP